MKTVKNIYNASSQDCEETGWAAPVFRRATCAGSADVCGTDVDDAAEEEQAEPASDKAAPADTAANGDSEPADDTHQVNAEAPATRLVNVERPPSRRPRASITTPIISSSTIIFSLSLQSFAPICRRSADSTTTEHQDN